MDAGIPAETAKPGLQIRVRKAVAGDAAAWDHFVAAAPQASFFHRFAWGDVLQRHFGLIAHYLIAERAGEIFGILPLMQQKSLLFGQALMSLPFCVEGGPVAADDAVRQALDDAAIALQCRLQAPFLEYRSRTASRPGWAVKTDFYATFSRALSAKEQDNLAAIPRKQRAVLRKAMAGPLRGAAEEGCESHYRVYSESLRNLGTPAFPKRYFWDLRRVFANDCDIIVIRDGAEPVSAVMNFYHKGTVLPYYGGGTAAARRNGANDLLYWEVMRHAVRRGCDRFDFGRSKAGTGAFAFKKNWGFEAQFLEYEYHLPDGAALPEKNPNNRKYAAFIAAWKKLPLPVANLLGPIFIRGLG